MQKLSEMHQRWGNLFNDVIDNEKDWKNWYDQVEPEKALFPCGYSDWCTPFQSLLLIRIFRPDRVYNAIKNFIIAKMGDEHYVTPLTPGPDKIFA